MKRWLFALAALALVTETSVPKAFNSAYRPSQPAGQIEDEYVRYELLAPDTNGVRMTYDFALVTAGATSYSLQNPEGSKPSEISVTDLMTGAPLAFKTNGGTIDITLVRPVPKDGQTRLRIARTYADSKSYFRKGNDITFTRTVAVRRAAIVLPKGCELVGANIPVQVIQDSDGRLVANFMNLYPVDVPLEVTARALKNPPIGTQDVPTIGPRTPQAPADAPPPSQPMDQIRVTERALQDREIVYFLKQPETHAFSLYHDYTAAREGEHQYVNVVRTGSAVSDPSAMILDTGEVLKTRILTGADIAREKIDISERVDPETEVVLIPFTPVKKGTSIRLRISETYTDPARYALINGQLMWHRSFGRNRNDMVLPDGWYLTTSSIPAVVSQEKDGRIRLSFWNGRPDNVDVFVKAARR